MKRLLTLSILLVFVMAAAALATQTRVTTMGDVNNIVKDEANISIYPSTINYYPNLFIGEFSGSDYWKAGANWQFAQESSPIVIGTYFSKESFYYRWRSAGYLDLDSATYHRIDLYGGITMGEMPIGLNIRYFNGSSKNEDDDYWVNKNQSMSYFRFAMGASLMKKLDASAYIGLTTWTDEAYHYWGIGTYRDSGMVTESEPAGNMDIGVNARYWMDPMGKYTLVPHIGFMITKTGADIHGEINDSLWMLYNQVEDRTIKFDLGLGVNYEASEDVLFVGDFGFVLDKYKFQYERIDMENVVAYRLYEQNRTTMVLPYFQIGIDAKVFKWMDLRSGARTYWERRTNKIDWKDYSNLVLDDRDFDKGSASYSSTKTYLGAGFNWGNFTIDAEINTNFIKNGPYFISGAESSSLANQVTLKYAF